MSETKRGVLKCNGRYLNCVDLATVPPHTHVQHYGFGGIRTRVVTDPVPTGDDQFPVLLTDTAQDVELEKREDGTFTARFLTPSRLLSIFGAGSPFPAGFQSRDPGAPGSYETLRFLETPAEWPSTAHAILGYVAFDGVVQGVVEFVEAR
jgi:hypothetical protein